MVAGMIKSGSPPNSVSIFGGTTQGKIGRCGFVGGGVSLEIVRFKNSMPFLVSSLCLVFVE